MSNLSDFRIVVIGCVEFTRHCLLEVLGCGANVVGIFTLSPDKASFNADYVDLSEIAEHAGIPLHQVGDIGDLDAGRIEPYRPDAIFVWGWSRLISDEVLALARVGSVGVHPALLPSNRGRHPLIWAIQLDLSKTGLTFFWMDSGADSGDILAQREIPLRSDETARSLYDKIEHAASIMIPEFLPGLADGTAARIPQDSSLANQWRKRSRTDGRIDLRMTADAIDRLVRALGRPYAGAHIETADGDVRVWRTSVEPLDPGHLCQEYGRVVAVRGRAIAVRVDQGLIVLLEHEFGHIPEEGSYL